MLEKKLIDNNGIPYTEEEIDRFIEPESQDDLEVNLTIRKYPKRYVIAFEIVINLPYDPIDSEDFERYYMPSKSYLWHTKYLHADFENNRRQILAEIKSSLQKVEHYDYSN